jgi:glycosyltransferase involved in cell wall biosynthesis
LPTPFLSIIIPAYNEERRLPGTLEQVVGFLREQPYTSEILIVDNASQDRTYEIAQAYARTLGASNLPVLAIQEQKRGKGAAVRKGMLEAGGQYRFMCDADLSMPITEINRFLPPELNDFDIAIASRESAGARRYGEPAYRHLVGRLFNTLIRVLALPSLQDTQCGFKCFRSEVACQLFPQMTIQGWSFDVEILFIARKYGYRIVEIPIPWYYNPDSHIRVLRDSFQMALDIVKIRLNRIANKYEHAR